MYAVIFISPKSLPVILVNVVDACPVILVATVEDSNTALLGSVVLF